MVIAGQCENHPEMLYSQRLLFELLLVPDKLPAPLFPLHCAMKYHFQLPLHWSEPTRRSSDFQQQLKTSKTFPASAHAHRSVCCIDYRPSLIATCPHCFPRCLTHAAVHHSVYQPKQIAWGGYLPLQRAESYLNTPVAGTLIA